MSSSQDHGGFEYVGRKQIIHGNTSDLEIQIESVSLEFESIVLGSEGSNPDIKSSLYGESQVEDPKRSQSTTNINNLSCPENSCMSDWSEEDAGFLGRNVENTVEGESHLEFEMTENPETSDTIQCSDIVLVLNKPSLGCPQLQVGDPRLSQSTTSLDDLNFSENSCIEVYTEADGGFLGRNVENNVEQQSQFKLRNTEQKTTDTIQSSDIALVIYESVMWCTEVEDPGMSLVTTSTDKLLSCPENSCMQDWSQADGGFLESNLESNVKSQSQLELVMMENSEIADIIQSSDIVLVLNEPIQGSPQVEPPRMTQSPTSINNLRSYPESSSVQNWNEGDRGFLGRNVENNEMIENSETTQGCPQVGDPTRSQSATVVDHLLSCPENSCMEDYSEGDGGILGRNLENNVEQQSQFKLGKTEQKTTDTMQSSDIGLIINECVAGCPQDLNVEKKVMKCIDSQYLDQDYSPKLCEPVSEMVPPSMNQSENEIPISENIECIIPKRMSMLELLFLTSRESQQKNIRKKLAPIWKMIADHRLSVPFLKPLTDRKAPGYKDIVKRPMDLSTIKKGLSKGRIRTSAEFQRDVLLMLQNAVMYNSVHHIVHRKALEMQIDVEEWLQVFQYEIITSLPLRTDESMRIYARPYRAYLRMNKVLNEQVKQSEME